MPTKLLRIAVLSSAALLAVRLYAADLVGFGDAEALYACYARHPQAVYVDHPGLIGAVARLVGRGDAPSPASAHTATALVATAVPWLAALAARALGASWRGALVAALTLMVTPEIAVGTFGLTPDLALIILWYAALGFAGLALRSAAGSLGALAASLAAGMVAGLACDAKASGVLLVAGLVLAYGSRPARRHLATLAPWAALLLCLLVVSPVVSEEAARNFPMLRHRLVETQGGAGLSARNFAALVFGQLLYVTPPLLWGAGVVARDLWRERNADAPTSLLFLATAACAPLILLMLVSRVAEPHWLAHLPCAAALHRHTDRGSGQTLARPGQVRCRMGVGDHRLGAPLDARPRRPARPWTLLRGALRPSQ